MSQQFLPDRNFDKQSSVSQNSERHSSAGLGRASVAAVVALALVGSMILFANRPQPNADASAPAPAPTRPIGSEPPLAAEVRAAEPSTTSTTTTTVAPTPIAADGFQIEIDPTVVPAVDEVEGFADGEPARPVGRLSEDGDVMDVVLDELIVSTKNQTELDAILARWNATLVDTMPFDDGDEYHDHLIRIDTTTADVTQAAVDLAELEPHDGTMSVGTNQLVKLIAVLGAESVEHDTIVAFNQVDSSFGVADATAEESGDLPDPFTWSYIQGGGTQDFAVGPAWQLLETTGHLNRSVSILINDGGFSSNFDFPRNGVTLRHASWGDKARYGCSGGTKCPYHGTDVTLTAVGQLDNEYGTVGPAGPVVEELVLVAVYSEQYKRLRKLDQMVDQYRPDVVNMSYGRAVTSARNSTKDIMNRRYKKMYNRGALLVAAAGNDGYDIDQTKCVGNRCYERRLVLPCESTYVMCVAGLDARTVSRDAGSNFGSKDGRESVEIWGPYDVLSINDANRAYLDYTTKWIGGTSFASPFVAGIAGLVKAADPSLSNDEVRKILNDTANGGVQNSWITGSQRRVDALAAVASALDIDLRAPVVAITGPDGGESYPVSQWLQLKGTATDYRGVALPIVWVSSIDGELANQIGTVSLGELSLGAHTVTATAVDNTGQVSTDTITFDVIERPPDVVISSPNDGTEFEEGDVIVLAAGTAQPDNFNQPLAEDDVLWEVFDGGDAPVWSSTGHDGVVLGHILNPGTFEARFTATANGGAVANSVHFTVTALPPGHTKPVPEIVMPQVDEVFNVGSGPASVRLKGTATDAEDGDLSGQRFRWVARADGEEVVLCTGSQFLPPTGIGKLAVLNDCSDVTVDLKVSPGAPTDFTWQIYLEVRDFAGDIGAAVVSIDIVPHAG